MTFLRYMTLESACRVHPDVRLVLRDPPVRPSVSWDEGQDFRLPHRGKNWMPEAERLPLTRVPLEDVAPEIARLGADDVHTSDLLAWHLLATRGGTVCDMDIVFLAPPPPIRADVQITVHARRRQAYVPIGFLQGRPCEKWAATFQKARANYNPDVYQSCGGENLRPYPPPLLSPFVVYPWGFFIRDEVLLHLFRSKRWPSFGPDCIGVHWYAGGAQAENQRIGGPADLGLGAVAWAVRSVLAKGGGYANQANG
jgi:hypothetical protein